MSQWVRCTLGKPMAPFGAAACSHAVGFEPASNAEAHVELTTPPKPIFIIESDVTCHGTSALRRLSTSYAEHARSIRSAGG